MASNVSLASNIIFFIGNSSSYGFLMGLPIIFYTSAQLIVMYVVRKVKIDFNVIRTIADLWYSVFPSKFVVRSYSAILAFAGLLSVFLEIFVGMEIVTVFLPETIYTKPLCFMAIGIMVIGYVYFGGFNAVVKTDKLQMTFLGACAFSLLIFAVAIPATDLASAETLWKQTIFFDVKGLDLILFVAWVCSLNFLGAFNSTESWHRMSASASLTESMKGILKNWWKFALVFLGPMFAIIIMSSKGYEFSNISQFVGVLSNGEPYQVFLVSIVALGFAAALFSTADTSLMATLHTIADKHTFLPFLAKKENNPDSNFLKRYLALFMFSVLFICSVLLFVNENEAAANLVMPTLYLIWNLMTSLAALPIYALLSYSYGWKPLQANKFQIATLGASVLLSFIVNVFGNDLIATVFGEASADSVNLISVILIMAVGMYLTAAMDPQFRRTKFNKPSLA